MKAHIKLGRIFGVKIGLHYSWFIIALLVMFSLAGQFYITNPDWGMSLIWISAITTSLLFFVALLAHELSHAIVARARGLPVHGVTLFALGGVAETEKDSADAETEFLVGVVGPITSAVIGIICLSFAWIIGWVPFTTAQTPLVAIMIWLGYINIALALFNMIPGFPLDGGRVLRALIWWSTGDVTHSTRIAAGVGQFFAFGLMIFGLFRFFGGAGLGGLWLVFIGWFLLDAARASYAQIEINEMFSDVRVGDAMARDCMVIDGRLNLQTFVDDVLTRTGRRCFVVGEKGHITGLVTPHEIKKVERHLWPYITVNDVMRRMSEVRTIAPNAPITDALEVMGREDLNQLPVTNEGRLEGIVSRGNILSLLQNRVELQI
jgi:Zn-dependent protease/predicted transcriptional regulator